ncbi:MAG: hypothetical protein WED04_01580 [Promethearchaeati archaeon SRVP18_Atabeyarchaeia-1]
MEKQKEKGKVKGSSDREEKKEELVKEGPDVDLELKKLEQQVAKENRENAAGLLPDQSESGAIAKQGTQLAGRTALEYPKWIDYPWMYTRPLRAEYLDSWLKDWGDFILKWCQFTVHHVVGLKDFNTSKPFDKLPEKELRDILQFMIDRGLGKWIDKDRTVARIMWRSLQEWATELYEWAYRNGVEILDVPMIRSANKDFSTLPVPDIRGVMDEMVKNKQLKWIDRNHEQAKLIFQ